MIDIKVHGTSQTITQKYMRQGWGTRCEFCNLWGKMFNVTTARECKVILGLITCSLHRSLWSGNTEYTLLKNIYSILWWSEVNKFDRYHSVLLGIISYRSPRQQESTELIFLYFFLYNAFSDGQEPNITRIVRLIILG